MNEISLETVAGKLNTVGYDAFMKALRQARTAGNRNVEMAHLLLHLVQNERTDVAHTLTHLGIDKSAVVAELVATTSGFRANETEMPGVSTQIIDLLDRGWHYATLLFGELQIRSGHLLVAALKSPSIKRAIASASRSLGAIDADALIAQHREFWQRSDESNLRPMDGFSPSGAADGGEDGLTEAKGTTALDRFSIDMTAQAASGKLDPIVGRDEEIRQIIDVLSRRRQNNPILTGEAGVGKTAVVEGFAHCIASGDVPPALRNVRLLALDIGLMQAGASLKGEFEQRLRSVIDEVQSSPTPIILFIDEAHTLVGAGGAQGTGDAANLLKPALARGTLRTIGATTWAEYRQYFEKDPALTRRFQPVHVDEPSIEKCCYMLRGILGPMEKHHNVRISDAALVAAVQLSARYIPARQLPDKAVSLLDTACARVAISQSTTPAALADIRVSIEAAGKELDALGNESELGSTNPERIAELEQLVAEKEAQLAERRAAYDREKELVDEIIAARSALRAAAAPSMETPEAQGPVTAEQGDQNVTADEPGEPEAAAEEDPAGAAEPSETDTGLRLEELNRSLSDIRDDERMVFAHVDEQAIAAVVSAWTGIPVGRMVRDEIQSILKLSETLNKRVIGQAHGIDMITRRIETSRAKLDNPNKPIGVFMLCGPSGVGKTETALALAEAIYGGEQNIITINMSEFQEAHTVSLLKGAPPGYVGYGEGGRLTEAVRRKPYSVVLLDEVEKAHSDVHELFFQVFDKGRMEDGTGRVIDFKNTLIILTSNVGTEAIMQLAAEGKTRPDVEELSKALRPYLQQVFPPALLGRIVTIPYFPLSQDMLGGIVKLQLEQIKRRVRDNHNAELICTDGLIDYIVSCCNDPDSGGRMIDNIITNTLLPDLARHFLHSSMEQAEFRTVTVDHKDGNYTYALE
ncbi:type VI secretion system ATPase TssH [Hoeflea ulvae]|uniref:Type VI secretion system ATPase TssH n=1 Tax=Hoeflea ulvae TaxID=2983764 RepID=A0ABT3YH11_9HYPH|nr:type VI secretion system ATPase TssH [Hoeflea ulvae]MCY0095185.1 type VI secretion system ATPase TssH [Hoeflea ulvae]